MAGLTVADRTARLQVTFWAIDEATAVLRLRAPDMAIAGLRGGNLFDLLINAIAIAIDAALPVQCGQRLKANVPALREIASPRSIAGSVRYNASCVNPSSTARSFMEPGNA